MSVVEQHDVVTPAYRHIYKRIQPGPCLELGDSSLKWYDIAPPEAPVPESIRELARDDLQAAAGAGELGLSRELGFAILHRCGESFYFLLVCTWRNENELWETVWAKDGDEELSFRPWPSEGPHRPTYCVWELGAVWHEQQAWSRYLRSRRDAAARVAYLSSSCRAAV
jgi:hypothetical protein